MVAVVEGGCDMEVAYRDLWFCREPYVALDAADAPEVLTFEIRSGTPTIDLECQVVLSLAQMRIQQIFHRRFGILAIPNVLSVEIDVHARFGSVDVQKHILSFPCIGHGEGPLIDAHGNLVGKDGRLGAALDKLVWLVDVDSRSETLHLPVARHADRAPPLCVGLVGCGIMG